MSAKVIQNFISAYSYTIVDFCKHSGITHLPYPKKPINTDKRIYKYHEYVEKYVNAMIMHRHKCYSQNQVPQRTFPVENEYSITKIKKEFPKQYFNYESF